MSAREARDKKRGWTENMAAGARQELSAGKAAAALQDRFAVAEALVGAGPPVPVVYLPLEEIKVRSDAVRPVHEAHALELALSIAAVGLIHFPVVNGDGELIAGGQRRAAIEFLHLFKTLAVEDLHRLYARAGESEEEQVLDEEQIALLRAGFDRHFSRGVPVHRLDMAALPPGTGALTIEAIENEKRLDFSRVELHAIVEKLRAAGFRDRAGRPRAGERTLATELGRITGKSRRTVFRLLDDLRDPAPEAAPQTPLPGSRALARSLAHEMGVDVQVRDNPKKRGEGAIIIRYRSFQERSDALRRLGLRE